MRLEVKKYLYDIQRAANLLTEFTHGKTFADYERDAMLRAAVEREFEVIGEAMNRLQKSTHYCFPQYLDPPVHRRDDQLVWDVVETKLGNSLPRSRRPSGE